MKGHGAGSKALFDCIHMTVSQVAHLINIETDQMYYNRKLQELQAAQLRPPMVAIHNSSKPQFPLTALEEANSTKAVEQR